MHQRFTGALLRYVPQCLYSTARWQCFTPCLLPPAVLRAIGVGEDLAHTSIRFGLGRFTTEREVDFAIDLCVRHVTRLREMSPLWEMVQEGVDISKIQWTQEH